jgi:hypothetical protein
MNPEIKSFGSMATGLARNPLGIIALFIVLIYGFASLVTGFAGGYSTTIRQLKKRSTRPFANFSYWMLRRSKPAYLSRDRAHDRRTEQRPNES